MITSAILRDVRIALNQNHRCEALIAETDLDTLTLNELILSQAEPVAADVVLAAPLTDLGEGRPFYGPIHWSQHPGHGPGSVILPPDFLRLVVFRMSGWQRPATLIAADAPRAAWQHSPFPGIHGNPCRPVAFIRPTPVGSQLFFAASCDGRRAHIIEARYVPVPRLSTAGQPATDPSDNPSATADRYLSLPPRLYHPFIRTLTTRVKELLAPPL